jgi:hypothetical protein
VKKKNGRGRKRGGAVVMGHPFKRAQRGGGGTVRGRCHTTARSGEGRGGQRGDRAVQCGRQRCSQVACDWRQNRGGGGAARWGLGTVTGCGI